jgi:hypothetical protein
MDMQQLFEGLVTQGYVVYPLSEQVKQAGELLLEGYDDPTMPKQPCGIPKSVPYGTPNPYAAGGFSALGTPTSFHHPVARAIRWQLHHEVFQPLGTHLQAYLRETRGKDLKFVRSVVDRMLIRYPGQQPSRESWHRDNTPTVVVDEGEHTGQTRPKRAKKKPQNVCAATEDLIFGGWVNVRGSSSFICAPGTHLFEELGGSFDKLTTAEVQVCKESKTTVEVPVGHGIIFFQNLCHMVAPPPKGKTDKSLVHVRLFTGFHLTNREEPMVKNLVKLCEEFRTVPLKSGQRPAMYPGLYLANWSAKLLEYSGNYAPELWTSSVKVRKDSDERKACIVRYLEEVPARYTEDLPEYTADELAIYTS